MEFCTLEVAWQEGILDGTGKHSHVVTHPKDDTSICYRVLWKSRLWKECLVKSTAGTWEAPDSKRPTAGKQAEIHHGLSPGEQGLTNPMSWLLWPFTYSTQLSIALHGKTANSSGNKKCRQLWKNTMKPVTWVLTALRSQAAGLKVTKQANLGCLCSLNSTQKSTRKEQSGCCCISD